MQGIAVSKNIEKTEDDENKTKKPMKQHIQVWHFVIYVFTSIAAVVTGAMMISSMYTNHEERILNTQKNHKNMSLKHQTQRCLSL
jgi:hypothetical protein